MNVDVNYMKPLRMFRDQFYAAGPIAHHSYGEGTNRLVY